MAKNYKVKADYTLLRKKSQAVDDGNIFENDIMTISPMDGLFNDDGQILYTDSNFRFSVNKDKNLQKRHARSSWVKTPNGESAWTYSDVSEAVISEESEVRIKSDYSKLHDFACFGSATKMVQGAITDVILNFPAELYFTDEKVTIGSVDYYVVSNEFGINADLSYINDNEVTNPMRYLCSKIGDYNFVSGGTEYSGLSVTISAETSWACGQEGIFARAMVKLNTKDLVTILTYRKGDIKTLLTTNNNLKGCSIRPYKAVVDNFFNTIDNFELVLLDRSSWPVYKSIFETPYETDEGYKYKMQSYIWPSVNGWNPRLSGQAYTKYVNSLISLADFCDEYYSNNLWRMDTHEAIKNLDWTFMRNNGDSIEDLSNIDTSRIEPMIHLYGRQYDGLKRYIDNIKHTNKVSYDQKNNLPDYHLTDVVNMSGWEALVVKPKAQSTVSTVSLYSGMTGGYTEVDMNTNFMRNLKINSKAILSMKGTRKGLEAILGLLGLKTDEYEINEKIGVAKGKTISCLFNGASASTASTIYPSYDSVTKINERKDTFVFNDDESDNAEMTDMLQGLAVKQVKDYVVPWFDSEKEHDGDWYFQCQGGWGKRRDKRIDLPELTKLSAITASNSFPIYDETEPYLKFTENITSMLNFLPGEIEKGDVCYVNDLTDIESYKEYGSISGDITTYGLSHYFILQDTDLSGLFGENGWRYVRNSDILSGTSDGKKVIYLESLIERTDGNNPHIGNGKYDDGEEYIEYLNQIFKDAIESDGLSLFTKKDIEEISGYTFEISSMTDNDKCYYFLNKTGNTYSSSTTTLKNDTISSADKCTNCVNPENGDIRFTPAANSIVNLKNLEIVFKYPSVLTATTLKEEWKEYIDNIVMEYVKQMIPSTTILSYHMSGETVYSVATPIDNTSLYSLCGLTADGIIYTAADTKDGDDSSNAYRIIKKNNI